MYKYKLRISVYNTNLESLSIIKLRISVFNAKLRIWNTNHTTKKPSEISLSYKFKISVFNTNKCLQQILVPIKTVSSRSINSVLKKHRLITTCFLPCQCDKMIHIAWCKESKMLIYAWCKYWLVSRMPAPHRPQPPVFFSRGTCDLSGQINFNALANWTELYFASWYVNAKEPEVMSNFMQLYP